MSDRTQHAAFGPCYIEAGFKGESSEKVLERYREFMRLQAESEAKKRALLRRLYPGMARWL